jgi:hypothetical protein
MKYAAAMQPLDLGPLGDSQVDAYYFYGRYTLAPAVR